jgi:hypothetical protein
MVVAVIVVEICPREEADTTNNIIAKIRVLVPNICFSLIKNYDDAGPFFNYEPRLTHLIIYTIPSE